MACWFRDLSSDAIRSKTPASRREVEVNDLGFEDKGGSLFISTWRGSVCGSRSRKDCREARMLKGIDLTLMIGLAEPLPVPKDVLDALTSVGDTGVQPCHTTVR